MNLHTNYPYWLLNSGIIKSYPSLLSNAHAEVIVMGAGISGALSAWHLCNAGYKVVVLEKRHAGMGSTAASTALLQYEIDTPLHELIPKIGQKKAVASYLLCMEAIHELKKICTGLKQVTSFQYKPSLQYASYKKDVQSLETEYLLRKQAGIDVRLIGQSEIESKFGFTKDAALLSAVGAEVDAYELTHALLHNCIHKGAQVYDNTTVETIDHQKRGVSVITSEGYKITARKLVIACGYESEKYLPFRIQDVHTTYAMVSEPLDKQYFWYKNALIWETARPYLYLRTTTDHRILIGGKDSDFSAGTRRDEVLPAKAKALQKSFAALFPGIRFKPDFVWAGSFAGTKDGLPYIGKIPQRSHTYFALGFGGNGITFSLLAAQLITSMIEGKSNKYKEIFSFDR
ncbi:NAD(P)/FAD-dependent oxidoreductase [Pinibacter aurantiacus]|uniref:FAD-binding oxidoreductase n=1 Tax=Pinibacter aurantiacus TaxID=2851599 RepID=A0A9E2SDR2_9BACT|nr:FAD-dependent oxidoreductase [Pinibacter aurantiacus]MBV4358700.1 FAD-binding oxidoreductase [Pinibacter aurantiacus]